LLPHFQKGKAMEHNQPQNLDINAMRQKLKTSRETVTPEKRPQNKSYIPNVQNSHYELTEPTHNPHIQRAPSFGEKLENYKPVFHHLHLYWHLYLTAATFILFHSIGMFPQYFPGTGDMESLYGRAPMIAFFFLTIPSVFVYFVVSGLRRSLQNAARITESSNWTKVEWTGAMIGFGLVTYLTFFRADPLEAYMVEEAIKGPFELTPREWIMAGVKCVGGAVTGAIVARKFFGDMTEE